MTPNENMNVLGEKFKRQEPSRVLAQSGAIDSRGSHRGIKTPTIPRADSRLDEIQGSSLGVWSR